MEETVYYPTETEYAPAEYAPAEVAVTTPCNAPAPLVINGTPYCGCQLRRDHEGAHEVRVTWQR